MLKNREYLKIDQLTQKLTLDIYGLLSSLPIEQKFIWRVQIRRVILSLGENLACMHIQIQRRNQDNLERIKKTKKSLLRVRNILTVGSNLGYFSNKKCQKIINHLEYISITLDSCV